MFDKEKIFGLDLMRCLAICCVLFAHTFYLLPFSERIESIALRFFGFIGVEIFFVLSGYLVGRILIDLFRNNPVNFRTTFYFWIRRWFRTLPNYYLALLLTTAVFYFSYKSFIFSDPSYLLYFIFSQNLGSVHPDFFAPAWSLSVEEWFYFITPLWFILWHKIVNGNKVFIITAIISFILLILVVRLVGHYTNIPEWNAGIRRVVIYRLDAIMIGVLAAYFHLKSPEPWKKYRNVYLVVGLVVLAIATVYSFQNIMRSETGPRLLLDTIFFTLISSAIAFTLPYLSEWKVKQSTLFHRSIAHISRISYSIYLIHLIVVFVVITLVNKISVDMNLLKFVASWVFCILAASVLYAKFELPMMNKREKYKLKSLK